jgi:acetoacetyl-CoA synthetase
LEKAANIAAVDEPDALRWYAAFAAERLRSEPPGP